MEVNEACKYECVLVKNVRTITQMSRNIRLLRTSDKDSQGERLHIGISSAIMRQRLN